MLVFDIVRETVEGLKLGARYSVSKNHTLIEKAIQPKISSLGNETFGR
ncbi:MAG: hypothetical protein AAF423_12765 [Pseudomonadota bacterium]